MERPRGRRAVRADRAARPLLGRLAWAFAFLAGCAWGAQERPVPQPGRVDLVIIGDGREVRVELRALVASLAGFEGRPSDEAEREALHLTRENLETGDGLVRFGARAACLLGAAEVDMGSDARREHASGAEVLSARYRFECGRPELLESAAVGLFVAFPALQRVFVRYRLGEIRGEAQLNSTRPVVSFVPLY